MFAVDDIAAAVERVRAAGGTATDPERQPYGTTSDCTDDQGLRFYLGELTLIRRRPRGSRAIDASANPAASARNPASRYLPRSASARAAQRS